MQHMYMILPIYNLVCDDEARTIEHALGTVPGVMQVYANLLTEMVYIKYDSAVTNPAQLTAVLDSLGYAAPPPHVHDDQAIAYPQPSLGISDRHGWSC